MAQEQQGAAVGPMQIVDNQENRCASGRGRKQLGRRLEQAVAAAVRRSQPGCLADVNSRADLRDELRQLAAGFDARQMPP